MKTIWACNQCKYIVHTWPKMCSKHNKQIICTSKIPNFCHIKNYISKGGDDIEKDNCRSPE